MSKYESSNTTPGESGNLGAIFRSRGTVSGSLDNVESEESFLCDRLLHEISTKRSNLIHLTNWISCNTPVPSVVQGMRRPVCGLVALCMAGHMLRNHDPNIKIYDNDEEILEIAKKMNFSKQGEMFSVKEYADLARRVLDCDSLINTHNLASSWKEIFSHISLGYPVLVPYDSDRNFEPCLKRGHKAHWAILTGFMIGLKKCWTSTDKNSAIKKVNVQEAKGIFNELDSHNIEPSLFYVYAKQGKSAKQQLWSLNELSNSNANLIEVSPDRDNSQYQIPPEGVEIALRSKSVLLFPKHHLQP